MNFFRRLKQRQRDISYLRRLSRLIRPRRLHLEGLEDRALLTCNLPFPIFLPTASGYCTTGNSVETHAVSSSSESAVSHDTAPVVENSSFTSSAVSSEALQGEILRFRLALTDSGGLNDISSTQVGESATLNVYVEDLRTDVDETDMGVAAGYLDVTYDNNLFSVTSDPTFGDDYQELEQFNIDTPGLVDETGSAQTSFGLISGPVGSGEFLLFSLPFSVDAAANVIAENDSFTISEDDSDTTFDVLNNESYDIATFSSNEADNVPINNSFFFNDPGTAVQPEETEFGSSDIQVSGNVASLTITNVGNTTNGGTVNIIGSGSNLQYTPSAAMQSLDSGESDTDSFTYTVQDDNGNSSTATVTVTINGADDANLDATDDAIVVNEDAGSTSLVTDLLANDDLGGDGQIVSIDTNGTTGTVLSAGGDVSYDPDNQFDSLPTGQNATDTFTYTLQNSVGNSDTATVTVTITGENDLPITVADAINVGEDDSSIDLTVSLLSNDNDADTGETATLQISSINSVTSTGSVQLNNGAVVYNPGGQFNSLSMGEIVTDSFQYSVQDTHGATSAASTVTITITGANDPPTAVNDTATTDQGTATSITFVELLSNDSDPDAGDSITITAVDDSQTVGTITTQDGVISYDPNGQFNALAVGSIQTDSFAYNMSDDNGANDNATAIVTITGTNDLPVAGDDQINFNEDGTALDITAQLLMNDSDIDNEPNNEPTIIAIDSTSTTGIVTLDSQGNVSYDPDGQFDSLNRDETTTDTFSYTITDPHGATASATVSVTIDGLGIPVGNDTGTTDEDTPLTMSFDSLLANDTVPQGSQLTILNIDNTDSLTGIASIDFGSSTITYNPNSQFDNLANGAQATESFNYVVGDTMGDTGEGLITITIQGVNDAPEGIGDQFTVGNLVASKVSTSVLNNDSDIDNPEDLVIVAPLQITTNAGAQATLDSAGILTFDPTGLFNDVTSENPGNDFFFYDLSDGIATVEDVLVELTVQPNTPPVAGGDTYTSPNGTDEDTVLNVDASSGVLNNDTDADLDPIEAVAGTITTTLGGSVGLMSDGSFSYDPRLSNTLNAQRAGTTVDTFTYTIRDIHGDTAQALVSIDVAANDDPLTISGTTANQTTNDQSSITPFAGLLIDDVDGIDAAASNSVTVTLSDGDNNGQITGDGFTQAGSDSYVSTANNTPETIQSALRALVFTPTENQGPRGSSVTTTFTLDVNVASGPASDNTTSVIVSAVNNAPSLTGTVENQPVNDNATINPFSQVAVSDVDPDDLLNVTVALNGGDANGVLSEDSFTKVDGEYHLTSVTPQEAQDALNNLTFTPTINQIVVGQTNQTNMAVEIDDGEIGITDGFTTVIATSINDAPVAANDLITVDENSGTTDITIDVLNNDSDLDIDQTAALSISSTDSSSTIGVISLDGGVLTYNPNDQFENLAPGSTATDSFNYTISDPNASTATATITITVNGQNDAPTALDDDNLTVNFDSAPVDITNLLLANDTDPDDLHTELLTITNIDDSATTGSVIQNGNGVLSYDPNGQFDTLDLGGTTTDTFNYTVTDPSGASDSATATITIFRPDELSVTDDTIAINEDDLTEDFGSNLLANDTNPGNGISRIDTSAGTPDGFIVLNGAEVNIEPKGRFDFIAASQTETIDFTYTVTDGSDEATATVSVEISGINDDPQAVADSTSFHVSEGRTAITDLLLANDSDPDNGETEALVISDIQEFGISGIVEFIDGAVFYDPSTATIDDAFQYTLEDAQGATSTGTVSIDVVTGNFARDDSLTFVENEGSQDITYQLFANDVTADGSMLDGMIVSVNDDAIGDRGILDFDETTGVVTYHTAGAFESLSAGESEEISFTYTIEEGETPDNDDLEATVTILINGVNNVPTAAADEFQVDASQGTMTLEVLANDSDVEGHDLTITSVSAGSAGGTIEIHTDGKQIEYTAPLQFFGTETFTYTIDDGNGATETGLVTVDVFDPNASALSGIVYDDLNHNGEMDSHENGIAGVTVTLDGNDSEGRLIHRTAITDESGAYSIDSLFAGDYTLNADTPEFLVGGDTTIGSQDGTVTDDGIAITLSEDQILGVDNLFGMFGLEARYIGIVDFLASTPADGLLIATGEGGQLWFSMLDGWEAFKNAELTLASDLSTAELRVTDLQGDAQIATIDVKNNPHFRLKGSEGTNHIVRLIGTPSDFNLQPVSNS